MHIRKALLLFLALAALSSFFIVGVQAAVTNLAVVPYDWGQYLAFGIVRYGNDPQITFVDRTVLHNGHESIRIDAHREGVDLNRFRELNGEYIPVRPGDHIVFKAWIKTGHSTLGQDGKYGNGGIIVFDYYTATRRLHEHSSDNPRNDVETWNTWNTYQQDPTRYVPYNSDWTLRTLDTIVPTRVIDDTTGTFATEPIAGIIPILQASGYIVPPDYQQDQGQVWFADAELYINSMPTFACSICGAGFASQAELDAHVANSHSARVPTSSGVQIAVSSVTASSYSLGHPPDHAVDGLEYDYWGTNAAVPEGTVPQWLRLDLGSVYSVNTVTTRFYDGDVRTYTYYIQVSTDGSSWTTVVPTKTGGGVVTDRFAAVGARYVRITITANTANSAAHIKEIKVYRVTT